MSCFAMRTTTYINKLFFNIVSMEILKITKEPKVDNVNALKVHLEEKCPIIDLKIVLQILKTQIIPDIEKLINGENKECDCGQGDCDDCCFDEDDEEEEDNEEEDENLEIKPVTVNGKNGFHNKINGTFSWTVDMKINMKKNQELNLCDDLIFLMKNDKLTDLDLENVLKKYSKEVIESKYVEPKLKMFKSLMLMKKLGDELLKL